MSRFNKNNFDTVMNWFPRIGISMEILNNIDLTAQEHLISGIQPDLVESLADFSCLRLWEIEDFFQRPIIGWCLDIADQGEILRKKGLH
jgi:hypothetical protein